MHRQTLRLLLLLLRLDIECSHGKLVLLVLGRLCMKEVAFERGTPSEGNLLTLIRFASGEVGCGSIIRFQLLHRLLLDLNCANVKINFHFFFM